MKPRIGKLTAIPIAVAPMLSPCHWELRRNPNVLPRVGDSQEIPFSFIASAIAMPAVKWKAGIVLPGRPQQPAYFDPLELREDFMRLKTDQEFLLFLRRVGRFSSLVRAEEFYGWCKRDLIGCQELFSQLACTLPNNWSKTAKRMISLRSNVPLAILHLIEQNSHHTVTFQWKGAPYRDWFGSSHIAVLETTDVVSTILATIEIDHLRGAKVSACARRDCLMFYEIASRHKRKYCSEYCGHLESVRNLRQRRKASDPPRSAGIEVRP